MTDHTPEAPGPLEGEPVVEPVAGHAAEAPAPGAPETAEPVDTAPPAPEVPPVPAAAPAAEAPPAPAYDAAAVPPPPPAYDAAAVPPPPPVYAAPSAAMVPVFPNGKPMLDAEGNPVSDKSRLAAALLCWFVGVLGVHRFYVGKVGTGVAMLLTCGGLGIWALIDLIVILLGSFRDQNGRALQNW